MVSKRSAASRPAPAPEGLPVPAPGTRTGRRARSRAAPRVRSDHPPPVEPQPVHRSSAPATRSRSPGRRRRADRPSWRARGRRPGVGAPPARPLNDPGPAGGSSRHRPRRPPRRDGSRASPARSSRPFPDRPRRWPRSGCAPVERAGSTPGRARRPGRRRSSSRRTRSRALMVSPSWDRDEIGVDVHGAEVVDQYRQPTPVAAAQQPVHQSGLARAQIATQHDRDRDEALAPAAAARHWLMERSRTSRPRRPCPRSGCRAGPSAPTS